MDTDSLASDERETNADVTETGSRLAWDGKCTCSLCETQHRQAFRDPAFFAVARLVGVARC
jgi:hypothetical protein